MILLLVFGLALTGHLVRDAINETLSMNKESFSLLNLGIGLILLLIVVYTMLNKFRSKTSNTKSQDNDTEVEEPKVIPKKNAIVLLSQTVAIASIILVIGTLLYLLLVEPWRPDPTTPYLKRYHDLTTSQFSTMFIMCASIAAFLVSTLAELFQGSFSKYSRATLSHTEAWCVVILFCEISYVWYVTIRELGTWWREVPTFSARDRTGLVWGLLWAGIGQIFVLVYHFARRELKFLRNSAIYPLIQPPRPPVYGSFFDQTYKHLVQPSSFILMGLYLSGTWIISLMPDSYYEYDQPTEWVHVLAQLLVVDFFTVVNHIAEHSLALVYIASHKPHHRYISPQLFDAFDGSTTDTSLLILLPLFCTMRCLTFVNTWSYVAFGFAYSTHFMLIHSEWPHPGDNLSSLLGIYTASDHHVHHARFKYNYAHFFTYWDRMLGTYKKDVGNEQIEKKKKIS